MTQFYTWRCFPPENAPQILPIRFETARDIYDYFLLKTNGLCLEPICMTGTRQHNHLLTLLQQWQSRLTRSNRAVFPWNPQEVEKPTSMVFPPTTSKSRTPTLPSDFVKSESTKSNTFHPSPAIGGVRIKQEPGIYDTNFLSLPQNNSHLQNQQFLPVGGPFRAAHLIGQQFGSQANASVAALQAAGMSLPGGQQRPHGLQLPGQVQGHPQYQQQHQQQPPQPPLK